MAGTWQALANQPKFNTSTMIMLTDGRVMVQEEATAHWHALTPDATGSYINGTWSTLADMSFWRRYYASGVLKDGRVIVVGGEQSGDVGDTNKGEIYDPVSDSWIAIPPPPGPTWSIVGDASCSILPDGRLIIGSLLTPECMIYDPSSSSWSSAASKAIRSNEETWILLPDDTIVAPQCFPPFHSEKYIISADMWKDEGPLPVQLIDTAMNEIGPGMLMYNGRVIFFGAANVRGHGKTVLYTLPANPMGTGIWSAGPDIPKAGEQTLVCNDCPAALMPNGKVLFTAAPFRRNDWGSPIFFFQYDPLTNTISALPAPPNNGAQIYWSRLMLLPTGQVLFSPSSNDIRCYTPVGGPQEAWRPTIAAIVPHSSPDYYLLKGTQLNGFSQANVYGDDCYPATNYPLIRLKSTTTNQVYYCRTDSFSTMGVATGLSLQSVRFTATNVPCGEYDLCVIANGISSHCINFCHCGTKKPHCCTKPKEAELCCCQETCEPNPCCCEKLPPVPAIVEIRTQVKSLQNRLIRLESMIPQREHVRQPKNAKTQNAR